ncbi:MAG: helix-turn-helix domain-containing protein [Mucilaginibacter sp.]
MSEREPQRRLGGHTQLFGEQLVTLKDLDNFKNELLTEVKKSIKETNGHPTKRWLKTNEVRKILGISVTTLLTLRINGILPYSKVGGVLYFDYDDILKVMEERKISHGHAVRQ